MATETSASATTRLHDLGQSLWLDNITRGLLTLARAGAQPQRLLWASTSTKDPSASDVLYIEALAAPDTINTIPDDTLRAFADHGRVTAGRPENALS